MGHECLCEIQVLLYRNNVFPLEVMFLDRSNVLGVLNAGPPI